ncbi:MAG TPA: TrbC/VirB2 family protein [Candidatus Saccharimonadales bacterium]|nr:TrbC/VirB2 family protein [Candidatus Saccharimonadales bacterium]
MKKLLIIEATLASLFIATPAFAATADISQVQNFIQNVIQVLVGLAGLTAAVFFVLGGFGYITSSGNPEHLDRSKKTIIYSGIGLSVALGSMVISNIVSSLATSAFGK